MAISINSIIALWFVGRFISPVSMLILRDFHFINWQTEIAERA